MFRVHYNPWSRDNSCQGEHTSYVHPTTKKKLHYTQAKREVVLSVERQFARHAGSVNEEEELGGDSDEDTQDELEPNGYITQLQARIKEL